MSTNDGGPAFPTDAFTFNRGMTLRDYFAGQALAGSIANGGLYCKESMNNCGVDCYAHADAMLAARDGVKEQK